MKAGRWMPAVALAIALAFVPLLVMATGVLALERPLAGDRGPGGPAPASPIYPPPVPPPDEPGGPGGIVSFSLDPATGTISGFEYTRGATHATVFSTIAVSPQTAVEVRQIGCLTIAKADELAILVHDNPAAVTLHHAGNASYRVEYTLGEGIGATMNGSRKVDLTGFHGRIILAGNGTLSVDGSMVIATLEPHASVLFLAHPAPHDSGSETAFTPSTGAEYVQFAALMRNME